MDLPDETQYRFVAILNKKIEIGKLMNALGHMTAGLTGGSGKNADEMCFLQYQDRDGHAHPNISHFPFVILEADNSQQIRSVVHEARSRQISYTDFVHTMTVGSSQEQQDVTQATSENDLEYYGVVLFGPTATLREFTKKFSLFK